MGRKKGRQTEIRNALIIGRKKNHKDVYVMKLQKRKDALIKFKMFLHFAELSLLMVMLIASPTSTLWVYCDVNCVTNFGGVGQP